MGAYRNLARRSSRHRRWHKPPIRPHTHAARPRSGAPSAWAWACCSPCHRPGLQADKREAACACGQVASAGKQAHHRMRPPTTSEAHRRFQSRSGVDRRKLAGGTRGMSRPQAHSPVPASARHTSSTARNLRAAILTIGGRGVKCGERMVCLRARRGLGSTCMLCCVPRWAPAREVADPHRLGAWNLQCHDLQF